MPKNFCSSNKIKTTISNNVSTAKFLIIVESPSKCSKIENYLGDDYCCIASAGHIRELSDGMKSIDKNDNFRPLFSIIEEKKKHVEYMRGIIKKFKHENIFLATDDDREGEAIAWHICEVFDLCIEKTPRIIFHEVTKQAIIFSLDHPTKINMNLVHSQQARQVLDVLVGYKISPYLWKYIFSNKSNSLSAGRCQTPALRLVYDNQKEKNSGKGIETKYKTTGLFTTKRLRFELSHEFESNEQVCRFLEISKTHAHKLIINPPRELTRSPPKPFHTSRILQVASNSLHISPKETMNLCQQLYQSGFITYMRTESSQYSNVFLEKVKAFIMTEFKEPKFIGNVELLENKDSSNPHEAIRVTSLDMKEIDSTNTKLAAMYRLIWKNSLESCMSDAKYQSNIVVISSPMDYKYNYNIEVPLFLGWKRVTEKSISESEQNSPIGLLSYLNSISSTCIPYVEIESNVVIRNKHQHFTEASLINKLEELGIGRPSTFATIVETLKDRKYVLVTDIDGEKTNCVELKLIDGKIVTEEKEKIFGNEKKKLLIQPCGILTIEFLINHFNELFDYEYTKKMESELDTISSGAKRDWTEVCKNCYDEIKRLSKSLSIVQKQAFRIDDEHDLAFEKFGPVIKRKKEDGTKEYIPIKKTLKLDLEKIKRGEYLLEELVDIKSESESLGKYEGEDLYIKNGKFGPYIEWGEKKESLKKLIEKTQKNVKDVTIEDIETFFKDPHFKIDKNVLRILNSSMSVRNGKFGPYVYYKRDDMEKPQFLNIKKFQEGFAVCKIESLVRWICDTYKIPNP